MRRTNKDYKLFDYFNLTNPSISSLKFCCIYKHNIYDFPLIINSEFQLYVHFMIENRKKILLIFKFYSLVSLCYKTFIC